jgi:hypothetical protein
MVRVSNTNYSSLFSIPFSTWYHSRIWFLVCFRVFPRIVRCATRCYPPLSRSHHPQMESLVTFRPSLWHMVVIMHAPPHDDRRLITIVACQETKNSMLLLYQGHTLLAGIFGKSRTSQKDMN